MVGASDFSSSSWSDWSDCGCLRSEVPSWGCGEHASPGHRVLKEAAAVDVLVAGISHLCMEGKNQPAEKEHVDLRQGASRAGEEGMHLVSLPGGRVCIIMPLKTTGKWIMKYYFEVFTLSSVIKTAIIWIHGLVVKDGFISILHSGKLQGRIFTPTRKSCLLRSSVFQWVFRFSFMIFKQEGNW